MIKICVIPIQPIIPIQNEVPIQAIIGTSRYALQKL